MYSTPGQYFDGKDDKLFLGFNTFFKDVYENIKTNLKVL